MGTRLSAALAGAALVALLAAGGASAAAPSACPGRAIKPTKAITGEFSTAQMRSYVMVPFEVPRGTTAVRVKYCYDKPDIPVSTPLVSASNTLDLGLYEPRADTARTWGEQEFRGWGGSSHPDVTVSAEGFGPESDYVAKPRKEVAGKTTRGFVPGPVKPGEWAVELGVAGVVPPTLGNFDGKVAWRVEIELASDPAYKDQPYRPAVYDTRPARSGPGWYAGDMHVHAEHSNYGAATMTDTFEYAFEPLARGGAGLDFVVLSDYVSGTQWNELGRYQGRYPGKWIGKGDEVITYRGHLMNQGTGKFIDYRASPIYERSPAGALKLVRRARTPAQDFAEIHAAGGWTQINHPTIFPSQVPLFDLFCRGCPWDYSDAETRFDELDAIEVANGTPRLLADGAPNPFTVTAIDFYERALARGHHIAAIGDSDTHTAGEGGDPITGSPLGTASTVVHAEELSEPGVECAIKAGHTYAKVVGNGGPDLRFEARPDGWGGAPAIFGDTVTGGVVRFTARVTGDRGTQLDVLRNGALLRTFDIAGPDTTIHFDGSGPGRYRLQLHKGLTIQVIATPIWVDAGTPGVRSRDCAPLRVSGKVAKRVRGSRFATRCAASGARVRPCSVKATITTGRRGHRRTRTVGTGRAGAPGGSRRVTVQREPLRPGGGPQASAHGPRDTADVQRRRRGRRGPDGRTPHPAAARALALVRPDAVQCGDDRGSSQRSRIPS